VPHECQTGKPYRWASPSIHSDLQS
jgi:hypothetical protein